MSAITTVIGGCVAVGGFFQLPINLFEINQSFRKAVRPIADDSACQKVMRLAAEVFTLIGRFAAALGCISLGLGMISLGPQVGFFASVLGSAHAALPYFGTALGCVTVAALSSAFGGNVDASATPSAAESWV